MRAVKFCKTNLRLKESQKALEFLKQNHNDAIEIIETDCFRRCLQCRTTPFCRIQLTTIEAENAEMLVSKVIDYVTTSV